MRAECGRVSSKPESGERSAEEDELWVTVAPLRSGWVQAPYDIERKRRSSLPVHPRAVGTPPYSPVSREKARIPPYAQAVSQNDASSHDAPPESFVPYTN